MSRGRGGSGTEVSVIINIVLQDVANSIPVSISHCMILAHLMFLYRALRILHSIGCDKKGFITFKIISYGLAKFSFRGHVCSWSVTRN